MSERQCLERELADLGMREYQIGPALVGPDSSVANRFIAAHPTRFCTPGQAGSATCRTLGAPRPIRRVVIHALAVPSTARRSGVEAVVVGWQNAGRQASSHYLVDRNGTITQMVREADVAFHTPGNNRDSIGIEHADVCNDPAPLTTQLYERSAALVRDLAVRHSFAINDNTVAGHSQVNPNHGDPGPYWDWEYYFLLLAWDGMSTASRPIRLVTAAASRQAAPTGWQVQRRRAIPNDRCASRRDPWGATYWRAHPSTTVAAAELSLVVDEAGTYKVSLWWPDVSGANSAVPVDIEVGCLTSPCGGTLMQTVTVNQRPNAGRWNDVAVVSVTQTPAEVKVRWRRDSAQRGWILADALRLLKIATIALSPPVDGAGEVGELELDEAFEESAEMESELNRPTGEKDFFPNERWSFETLKREGEYDPLDEESFIEPEQEEVDWAVFDSEQGAISASVAKFAANLGKEWAKRRNGSPSAEEITKWLLLDYQDTLEGARRRFKGKYTAETIGRAWMISRQEQMDFKTSAPAGVKPLRNFIPPADSVALVSSNLISDSDKAPVAPIVVRFVEELRQRYRGSLAVSNYRGHGGGNFKDRGYSLDLFLKGLDDRGFYSHEEAVKLLRAVQESARTIHAEWRVIYNDFSVADIINRETGQEHVIFVGTVRRDKNKRVSGLNWHGPFPLILHFHLDLAPRASTPNARGTLPSATTVTLAHTLERGASAPSAPVPVANPQQPTPSSKKLIVTIDTLNVRSSPSLQGGIIGSLRKGENVDWLDSSHDGRWYKIQKDSLIGWSFHKYFALKIPGGPLDRIIQVAAESEIARYKWRDRGVAPPGYIKGMALVYARVYCKLKAGDAAVTEMAKANTGNSDKDALAYYAQEFNAVGMDNESAGVDTLRHLFVLLVGLGMRESSGRYCEGRDRSASNTTSETAEAGLFQTSYNARKANHLMPQLFRQYLANPSGFVEVFQEGISCSSSGLKNFGYGDGREFQRLSKTCPAFATEFAAVGLRNIRKHWGPINRKAAEIRPESDAMLLQVQKVVDEFNLCPVLR